MSDSQSVAIDLLPSTVQEFLTLRDRLASTPEGGAVMMVVALAAYADDPALGWPFLTIAVDRDSLQPGDGGYKSWEIVPAERQRIELQIRDREYLPRSYFAGTSPEESYRLPSPPYRFSVSHNPYSGSLQSGSYKVFVACSGAASPRPVMLKRNEWGIWKAAEWSSLLVGVMPPVNRRRDDL